MKVSRWIAPILTLVIFFGGIGIAKLTGDWQVSGRTTVAAGQTLTADDIKGWMSLGEVSAGTGIPTDELRALADVPEGTHVGDETQLKDLEDLVPAFEMTKFREKIRARLGGSTASPGPSAPASRVGTPTATPPHTPSQVGTQTITGQSTLAQVAKDAGVDVAALVAESDLPADVDVNAPLRELRDAYPDFSIQDVRDAVDKLT